VKRLRLALLIALPFVAGLLIATRAVDWFAGISGLFGGGTVTDTVMTDPAKMEQARVDPTPGLGTRLQLGRVKPTQVRIGTAPSAAGQKRVADYCTPALVGQGVQTSAKPNLPPGNTPGVIPQKVGARILPDFGGRVRGRKVSLQSTLNDGAPWAADYKVRGRWTFVSTNSSVVVRSERFWSRFARGLIRCGVIAGAGAGVGILADRQDLVRGAVRGAAIAGGTCAALEIAF